jgi:adenylate cyclase
MPGAAKRGGRGRRWWRIGPLLLAAFVPALLAGALNAWQPYSVRGLRDLLFDGYQRLAPRVYRPELPVRVVAIDDESLARIGRWPWSRARMADLVEGLTAVGAGAIVLDVLFSEPEEPGGSEGDRRLAAALAGTPAVLGFGLAEVGAPPAVKAGFAAAGSDPKPFVPRFGGAVLPLDGMVEASAGLGAMNFLPDRDLVVREVPTLFAVGEALVPSLTVEALRAAQGASTVIVRTSDASGDDYFGQHTGVTRLRVGALDIDTGRSGAVRIRFAGPRPERVVPAWQVLAGTVDRSRLEGAIVLVGATAAALTDIRASPLDPAVPGVVIHAEALESLLVGAHLTRPDFFPGLELMLCLLGSLLVVDVARRTRPLLASATAVALVGTYAGASAYAFTGLEKLLDPIWPSVSTLASYGAAAAIVILRSERERRQVREAFGRYLSPAIVEALARDPGRLALGGETRELTVLFSDIRGFTSRSESLSAEEVVGFLNSIHTPLTEHVLESGGTLDKFMGDGMMAFWNAPLDTPDHTRKALVCAIRMQDSVAEIDRRVAAEPGREGRTLSIGIGIHLGPACVGNVGSARRFDYSAIGDTVNTAARIEPLCKTFCVGILVSGEVVAAAPEFAYLRVGRRVLRGRERETELFALHGEPGAATEAFRRFRDRHDEAVRRAEAGDPGARDDLAACAADPIGTGYAGFYAALAEGLPAPARTPVSASA